MAELLFWASVASILYAYMGYPCVLFVLARIRPRAVRKGDIEPRVSFIIAARNEAGRIAEKIENTLWLDYPQAQFEILVASDCSTDDTDGIVQGYAPRVRLIRSARRDGKEAAQGLAVKASGGEILIFSDVATALDRNGVRRLVRNFADDSVGCVSSIDRFIDADGRLSGEGAYVKYEMWLRTLETRVNTLVGLSGSLFAARREVCRDWPSDRQSDFSTLLRTVAMGLRGVLDPESIGYYRNITDTRREFARKVRTVVRGISVLAANLQMLNPARHGLFAWQLASHKLLRWMVPFLMIAALVSNATLLNEPLYLAAFGAQVVFYLLAIAGRWIPAGVFRLPSFLCQANLAVLTAWALYFRGQRMVTWTPSDRNAALPQVNVR